MSATSMKRRIKRRGAVAVWGGLALLAGCRAPDAGSPSFDPALHSIPSHPSHAADSAPPPKVSSPAKPADSFAFDPAPSPAGPPSFDVLFKDRTHTFWIGGAADKEVFLGRGPHGLMEAIKTFHESRLPGRHYYRGYYELNWIVEGIKELRRNDPEARIVLIGHSFGGAAAMRAARRVERAGRGVDLMITLDPVWPFHVVQPDRCGYWINVHQQFSALDYFAQIPLIGPPAAGLVSFLVQGAWGNTSDSIATTGRQLGLQSQADENISVTFQHGRAASMLKLAFDHYRDLASVQKDPPVESLEIPSPPRS